jgi:SAM-dependent methyltransferase
MENMLRSYEEQTGFWKSRLGWTVMGDWLGRIPALQLLNPKSGELIIDAGCGEGLLTRAIADSGAQVHGIDRSEAMLNRAIQREKDDSKHILFHLRDITRSLPAPDNFVDAVNCVAVLMHDSPAECGIFFSNAARVLKPGGRLVVSITHPYCYLPGSPTTDGRSKWTQFDQIESGSLDVSRKFIEHYCNIHGQVFDAEVWNHPADLFPRLLIEAGLEIVRRQDTYVRPEHIAKSALWAGSPWGHPAFIQFVAVKT